MTLLFIETRDIPESGSIFPFSPVNKNRVKSSVKIVFRLKSPVSFLSIIKVNKVRVRLRADHTVPFPRGTALTLSERRTPLYEPHSDLP